MIVTQTPTFERKYKKLNSKVRQVVNEAITQIIENPTIGQLKSGDLGGIRVHKVRENQNQLLIAYLEIHGKSIALIDFGSHENFYRDLKRRR